MAETFSSALRNEILEMLVCPNTTGSFVPLASTESHGGSIDFNEKHVLAGVAILDMAKIVSYFFWSIHHVD
jgi:hypothetical protein